MSVHSASQRTDAGSISASNVLFPSQGSFRYASTGSENDPLSQTGEAAPNLLIWGTDVSVDTCKKQFIDFIRESRYTIEDADMDEAKFHWHKADEVRPLYLTKLEEISHVPNEPFLTINCAHLKEFNHSLYEQLIKYPSEVIQIFEIGANEIFQELYPEQSEQIIIYVRPFNIDKTNTIRGLETHDIGVLVTINGMVTRASQPIPEMVKAFFRCSMCRFPREVLVENGTVAEPHLCPSCNGKFSFVLIHNRSKFVDRQLVKLQESPDDMPAGQIPSTLPLIACAELVDKVSPGDRISVTGIYRATPVRLISRQRRVKGTYRVAIDVIHYRKIKSGRLLDESSALRFSPERIDKMKALSKEENMYTKMANSICPSIFGHLDVKKGVLLQLFGGTIKETRGHSSDPKLRHFRADINILLCGDPSTAKSQILQYVHQLVPRGQYTSGKGSSAVGLTAYVTRDVDTKQLVLQTGALVMCDGGICCIDEFDKMSDSTRSVLHEVMEQQTLSIAKAGIVCQLNARASILAAANPVKSAWDIERTILDNIRMPDTLLSRFDLVFLLLDPDNDEYDMKLGRYLVSQYCHNPDRENEEEPIDMDLLRDYIAYARAYIHPKMTDEADEELERTYLSLREASKRTQGRIQVYPRNLESLIRLSEAHAKMRLSDQVDILDVIEARRLTEEAAKYSATDPESGTISRHQVLLSQDV